MSESAVTFEPSGAQSSDSAAPWAELLERHRREWAERTVGERPIADLDSEADPAAALAAVAGDTAVVWLEGYLDAEGREQLRATLAEVGERAAPLIVGFAADRDGEALREAQELALALPNARLVTQELGAGSLIGAPVDPAGEAAARERSVHVLVCANVDSAGLDAPDFTLDAAAEPLMTGYVRWLERANGELRAANTRLARERLGVHDAAAAAVEARRVGLEEQIAALEDQLEREREATRESHRQFLGARSALEAPRYRAVDALRDLAFTIPGVSLLLRLRRRRVQRGG
jgi:hypothetical protein